MISVVRNVNLNNRTHPNAKTNNNPNVDKAYSNNAIGVSNTTMTTAMVVATIFAKTRNTVRSA
jgi:hypothetical protein